MLHVGYGYTGFKRDQLDSPSALVLPITSLDNLVFSRKDFLLKDLCPPAFVNAGHFEYLGRVHVGVRPAAHDRDAADHAFIDLWWE